MEGYLGLDVGSVSTNLVLINSENEIMVSLYLRTRGEPIKVVQEGLKEVGQKLSGVPVQIRGVGTTGSARHLTGVVVGADVVKNEITAHAVAANLVAPGVQTVLELGGQDSKIIILRHGVVADFAMNTVCAAGTGSFLDHQAARLGIPIEKFGEMALNSKHPVHIAGRCSVFAESDMVHKQQVGHSTEDIIAGLCDALVRNYLNNVGKGKDIQPPVVFQGGVAANVGIKLSFEKALSQEVIVPQHFAVMGALGAALISKQASRKKQVTNFRGFELSDFNYETSSFECQGCPNICEIVNISMEGKLLARWGSRCGKWDNLVEAVP
ncbi:MAG: 2-hydroxyglutaryl-CoA dehydratase [Firmicutes bacterium]|nr:2-hydroxyglutaryl-CoA dehydratase [Bacillota bacterium]